MNKPSRFEQAQLATLQEIVNIVGATDPKAAKEEARAIAETLLPKEPRIDAQFEPLD